MFSNNFHGAMLGILKLYNFLDSREIIPVEMGS